MAKSTTWYGKFTQGEQAIFFRLVTSRSDVELPLCDVYFLDWTYKPSSRFTNGNFEFQDKPLPNVVYSRQFLLKATDSIDVVELHGQEKFARCEKRSFVELLEQMLAA